MNSTTISDGLAAFFQWLNAVNGISLIALFVSVLSLLSAWRTRRWVKRGLRQNSDWRGAVYNPKQFRSRR